MCHKSRPGYVITTKAPHDLSELGVQDREVLRRCHLEAVAPREQARSAMLRTRLASAQSVSGNLIPVFAWQR